MRSDPVLLWHSDVFTLAKAAGFSCIRLIQTFRRYPSFTVESRFKRSNVYLTHLHHGVVRSLRGCFIVGTQ